ncbi:cell envelope biogenesis protein OmpA [Aliidongia dinghuensis]|uniref:Cell envelope biogenesis protein OmpA n=1 Tax=Aliidongia dinghuensis TaxID=1867774 RepID=A0A8J2YU82_9PROT|nr:type VI secretion system protein TssL, long form [Aliidongia dinghuensis]GGF20359.1 cell envelope biogenesis protein OmpA [Aliidongia dinghuensis]
MTLYSTHGGGPEQTIVKPTPGGRRPSAAPVRPVEAAPSYRAEDVADLTAGGINPLVAAAGPILGLVRRLTASVEQSNVDLLRERVIAEIRTFEKRVLAASVPAEAARAAHYALCATLDDVVLNTPWGNHSSWTRNSMVSTFHLDVSGGERFFDLLTHLHREPGANRDVLELMYLCLSLGFEGRLRIIPHGALELARIRDGLYRTLRQQGDFERELSPHWHGIEAVHRPLRSYVELWTIVAASVIIITLMIVGFSFALNRSSDGTLKTLATLPPTGTPSIHVAAPALPAPPPKNVAFDHLKTFLKPEIDQKLVTVSGEGATVTVRIRNSGMFPSGSATIDERYDGLVDRIAQALDGEPGKILITGHTDNVPIHTVRFPSNWHLSTARAEAVADMVKAHLADKTRVTSEGRADAEPLASNDTPEGRETNRRIDIMLTRPTLSRPAGAQAP